MAKPGQAKCQWESSPTMQDLPSHFKLEGSPGHGQTGEDNFCEGLVRLSVNGVNVGGFNIRGMVFDTSVIPSKTIGFKCKLRGLHVTDPWSHHGYLGLTIAIVKANDVMGMIY